MYIDHLKAVLPKDGEVLWRYVDFAKFAVTDKASSTVTGKATINASAVAGYLSSSEWMRSWPATSSPSYSTGSNQLRSDCGGARGRELGWQLRGQLLCPRTDASRLQSGCTPPQRSPSPEDWLDSAL
jgi:hypothetical protein